MAREYNYSNTIKLMLRFGIGVLDIFPKYSYLLILDAQLWAEIDVQAL